MTLITCNTFPVLELRLTRPVSGVWTSNIEVDSDAPLAGAVRIADEGITYQGTVVRSGVYGTNSRAELVGGKNGLSREVTAKSYRGDSARTVVTELLGAVGERLDSSSTVAVLKTTLPYWTRAAGLAKTALHALADVLQARWRVLPSGAVWFGRETWPAAPEALQALELERDDPAGTVLLAPETIGLGPGIVFHKHRVGRVEHHVGRSDPLRTTYWVEP